MPLGKGGIMTFSKRMMFVNIFLVALSASALWVSCDLGTNGSDDDLTVTYNAGGGEGTAPASQSVASGKSITLPGQGSMTAPGEKIFAGWSAGGQTYAAGASYTVTADITFTAQWVDTYTVTYSAGEGEGAAPDAQSGVVSGTSITLPGQGGMTAPAGKTFAGWSAGGQTYAEGASYTVTATVTFTAQWLGVAGISAAYDGQTDYGIGEPFDLTHLAVTAQYDNGTSGVITVTQANLAGWDNTTAGTQTITVTVGDHTASQTISVTVKTLAERIAAALETTGTATITLYADESLEPTPLSAASSTTITLQGSEAERTIRIGSGNGPLFTLGASVTLVLDSNITLQGKADNTGNGLVYVNAATATLTMKAGSKITGNTSTGMVGGVSMYNGSFTMEGGTITGNTGNFYAGGVYVNNGPFTMEGGTIAGNTGGYSGGVYVSKGPFTMTGGTITGNTGTSASYGAGGLHIYSTGKGTISGGAITGNTGACYGDVAVYNSRTLTLQGAPLIGSITLAAHATSDLSGKISVSAALTGGSYPVDLAVNSSSNLDAVRSRWEALTPAQRTIISGSTSPAYTPTSADIGKFTLRNFVYTASETQAVTSAYPGASIGTDGIVTLGSGGTVSGTVELNDSSSVSGANVALKKSGATVASTTTDSTGAYSFAGVEIIGGYTVEASYAGYASAMSAAFAVTSAGTATVPVLTLLPPTATLHDGVNLVPGAYTVLSALRWIAANAAVNGNYTVSLDANDTMEPYTINEAALNNKTGVTITLKGEGSERTLQIGAAKGPLFTLNTGTTVTGTLVLDSNITLQGKADNTGDGLVSMDQSPLFTLKMKDGSKITGNTSTGMVGGVYINYGSFTMEGGTITGNTSTYVGTTGSGGLFLQLGGTIGRVTISGGTITGNTGRCGDVLVGHSRTPLNLSGNPTIGNITLSGSSYDSEYGKVAVTGALTSSAAIPVDLARHSSANLAVVKTFWAALSSPQIIAGSTSPAYTLSAADIGKFTLRNFVHNASATEPVATTYGSAAIDNTGVLVLGAAAP
jgi:hypothetical protein